VSVIGHDQPERRPVLSSRCPLFGGKCDDGVLIGECPNRGSCARLHALEQKGQLFAVFKKE
jgi:hypothetical protein